MRNYLPTYLPTLPTLFGQETTRPTVKVRPNHLTKATQGTRQICKEEEEEEKHSHSDYGCTVLHCTVHNTTVLLALLCSALLTRTLSRLEAKMTLSCSPPLPDHAFRERNQGGIKPLLILLPPTPLLLFLVSSKAEIPTPPQVKRKQSTDIARGGGRRERDEFSRYKSRDTAPEAKEESTDQTSIFNRHSRRS